MNGKTERYFNYCGKRLVNYMAGVSFFERCFLETFRKSYMFQSTKEMLMFSSVRPASGKANAKFYEVHYFEVQRGC